MTARATRLGTVLRVRRLQEEAARARLLQARAAVAAAVQVEQRARRAYATRPAAPAESSAGQLRATRARDSAYAVGVHAAAAAVAPARLEAQQRHHDWSGEAQRLAGVERLVDRERRAVREAALRAEQQATDETAVLRWAGTRR